MFSSAPARKYYVHIHIHNTVLLFIDKYTTLPMLLFIDIYTTLFYCTVYYPSTISFLLVTDY